MQVGYGAGSIITIIAPFVVFFLGITNTLQTLFLVFLLFGLWTLVATFAVVKKEERRYYLSWGLLLAGISSLFVISIAYAIALILVVLIVIVLITLSKRNAVTIPKE